MKLETVQIENFRSIEGSNEFTLSPVTCLVGKNESGKTAILQALYKLNPDVQGQDKFDAIAEYPRQRLTDYEERLESEEGAKPDNVLTTTWILDDEDREALAEVFGPEAAKIERVNLERGYGNGTYYSIPLKSKLVVSHLLSSSDLHEEELRELHGAPNVAELGRRLDAVAEPSPRQRELLERVDSEFAGRSEIRTAINFLSDRLPTFVYFANYQLMPGQVSFEDLAQRQASNDLTFGQRVFLALLDQVGTSPEEIQKLGRFEQFVAKLEGVSNRLSREIFTYWSQNRHLRVDFRLDAARLQDPPPFNTGNVFRTRVYNTRHQVTVGFDERSAGFVWFFSFLVWFSQMKKNYGNNLIILLDEPGLSLHAKAQSDLLRYINEKLKPNYQVIYTTHSPFMIDPDNILSVRTVEDVVTKDGEILGTKVGDKVLSTDADTLSPLQAALGYDITQSLFVGKHTLLVEGPSDLLYLKWFSHELRRRKRTPLDPRWTISPAGGLDKVNSFVTLFSGNTLHVAVLTDFHEGDKKKVRTLRESELLREGHVFSAEAYAGQDEADVEDIIGRANYVALVNAAYGLKRPNALPAKKPREVPIRVLQEVHKHFDVLPPTIPNFDHYTPAAYLTEHAADLRDSLPDLEGTLERFEALFRDLNALLPA